MINAVIADDEKMSRNTLRKLLELYCPSVQVLAEAANAAETKEALQQWKPDLLFLDIAMPGQSGIELLSEMEEPPCEVIFVTAHNDFVLQALRLSAADYLLKPVDEQQLIAAVSNAGRRISQKESGQHIRSFLHNMQVKARPLDSQLCIPGVKGFQVVNLSDIIYCEADNTYTIIYLNDNKKLLASRPLMDYELLLQDSLFFRIHKSTLVNMKHIREYQKGDGGFVVMSNGRELEVSRRKKEQFITRMKEVFKY